MNCDKELILAYLEEDNIPRAYFRVRPLLTISGDMQEEAARLWPDHGCLRIVPDRNEQHTFKERMRTLGAYCVINLLNVSPEANKIRTNKNYRPDYGESNQFILYSDTVQAVPEHSFFQVLDGAASDAAALATQAITPVFYIRDKGALLGPVRRADPKAPEAAEVSSDALFSISCPDGQHRDILCLATPVTRPAPSPAPVERPAPVVRSAPVERPVPVARFASAEHPAPVVRPAPAPKPAQEESLPIGQPLHILDEKQGFEETLQSIAQPLPQSAHLLRDTPAPSAPVPPAPRVPGLNGTPLYRAPLHTSVPQPKNKLQEVVSSQWRIARNEPPAGPLPSGAAMNHVENPVEVACQRLRAAWQLPESRAQIVDFLFSLEGMRAYLQPSAASGVTPLQKALQERLQDLETERLTALVQLDKAKADLNAFRAQAVSSATDKAREELELLQKTAAELEEQIDALKKQSATLSLQRDEMLRTVDELRANALPEALAKALADAAVTAPVHGIPLRMAPVSGQDADLDAMLGRMTPVFEAAGVPVSRNGLIALILLLGLSPRIGLRAPSAPAAVTLMNNLVAAMGWRAGYAVQVSAEQTPLAGLRPADSAPCLLLSTLPVCAPIPGVTRMFLSNALPVNVASPWPIYPLPAASYIAARDVDAEPVSAASLTRLLDDSGFTEEEMSAVLGGVLTAVPALSGETSREMRRFIAAAAPLMEGGLPAACDWGLLLWAVPAAFGEARKALQPLVAEYPLTSAALAEVR